MVSNSAPSRGPSNTHPRAPLMIVLAGLVLTVGYLCIPYLPLLEPPRHALEYAVDITYGVGRNQSTGSGVIIKRILRTTEMPSGRSFILTAAHILARKEYTFMEEVVVSWHDQQMEGVIIDSDEEVDLALIMVDRSLPAAPMYFGDIIDGEQEIVASNPLGYGLVISSGYVSSGAEIQGKKPGMWYLEGTASAYLGSSGGGAFIGRNGRLMLAGIIQWLPKSPVPSDPPFLVTYMPIGTIHFAIPMERVRPFLKKNGMLD